MLRCSRATAERIGAVSAGDALLAQYRDTAAGLGDAHPVVRRLWALVEATAPDWFKAEMRDMALKMDLLPDTWGYDDSGQRLYSLDEVAAKLGMTPDEARQAVQRMIAEREALGLPTDGIVNDGRTIHLNPREAPAFRPGRMSTDAMTTTDRRSTTTC